MSAGTVALLGVLADCTARQVRLSEYLAHPSISPTRRAAIGALLSAVECLQSETTRLLNAGANPSAEWVARLNRVNGLLLKGAHLRG
jgi:hypothetical protein